MRTGAKLGAAALALAMLAGCEGDPGGGLRSDTRFLPAERQAFQATFQELPFAAGAVRVASPDPTGTQMRTWRLVPCGDGTRVCAGSAHGRAGSLTRGAEFWQVSGAYPGREFFLSPGGDGYMTDRGRTVPLSWATEVLR